MYSKSVSILVYFSTLLIISKAFGCSVRENCNILNANCFCIDFPIHTAQSVHARMQAGANDLSLLPPYSTLLQSLCPWYCACLNNTRECLSSWIENTLKITDLKVENHYSGMVMLEQRSILILKSWRVLFSALPLVQCIPTLFKAWHTWKGVVTIWCTGWTYQPLLDSRTCPSLLCCAGGWGCKCVAAPFPNSGTQCATAHQSGDWVTHNQANWTFWNRLRRV